MTSTAPKLNSWIRGVLVGFCLGTANIIPGVSGGTFLLIFNIYERVFAIVGNLNKQTIGYLLAFPFKLLFRTDRKKQIQELVRFFEANDFIFLIKLLTGSVIAILALSSLMKYLILNHFSATYALFLGLILVSVIIPVRMIKKWNAALLFFVFIGAALTIYVTWAVNPYEKVKNKSDFYKARYVKTVEERTVTNPEIPGSLAGNYTVKDFLYAFFSGAVAVSAMVLPGISGSLVLILMGEYFEVISAISGLAGFQTASFIFLSCFGAGIVLGGIFFARLISAVLKRFYEPTMSFLTGLMFGSLYALWPFKTSMTLAQQYVKTETGISIIENVTVYTNVNRMPEWGSQLWVTVLMFVLGAVIMSFFVKKEEG